MNRRKDGLDMEAHNSQCSLFKTLVNCTKVLKHDTLPIVSCLAEQSRLLSIGKGCLVTHGFWPITFARICKYLRGLVQSLFHSIFKLCKRTFVAWV